MIQEKDFLPAWGILPKEKSLAQYNMDLVVPNIAQSKSVSQKVSCAFVSVNTMLTSFAQHLRRWMCNFRNSQPWSSNGLQLCNLYSISTGTYFLEMFTILNSKNHFILRMLKKMMKIPPDYKSCVFKALFNASSCLRSNRYAAFTALTFLCSEERFGWAVCYLRDLLVLWTTI